MSSTIPSQSTSSSTALSLYGSLDGISHVPEWAIAEILSRLPVKPLLCLRCVSKPWCSLIDSPIFVKKHLRRTIECNPDSGIIVKAPQGSKFYQADLASLHDSNAKEIAEPIKTYLHGAEFVGSCNGLVCLWQNETDILLWNPATRNCRKLPEPTNIPIPYRLMESSVVGVGYDRVSDDYKVVRTADSQLWGILVTVYSLKSDSWTRAETITNVIRLRGSFGKFVNGALHWLATKADTYIIVAFDLGVKTHREFQLPTGANQTGSKAMGVIVFDRCVCLIDHYPDSRTDIWQRNGNGVGSSWSKLLSLEQRGVFGSFNIAWPIAYSQSRKYILLVVDNNEYKYMWYDPERNEVKNVTIHGIPDKFDSVVYTESLVRFTDDYSEMTVNLFKVFGVFLNLTVMGSSN